MPQRERRNSGLVCYMSVMRNPGIRVWGERGLGLSAPLPPAVGDGALQSRGEALRPFLAPRPRP
jgi:hypothetical protein